MGLICSIKDSLTAAATVRLVLFAVLLCANIAGLPGLPLQAAATTISAEPYPVGDIQVTREVITTDTYRLTLKNYNIAPAEANRSRAQTWLVAGTRGAPPQVEVESVNFIHLRNGRQTTATASPPETVRQNLVRVADLGLYRQYWVYTLTISSASPAGQDGFWVLADAQLKVSIGNPPAQSGQTPLPDKWKAQFGEDRMLGSMLLNPDISPEYYVSDYGDPVETWSDWTRKIAISANSGGLFRFSIYHGGLYKLSQSEIARLTSATVSAPPATWRVYLEGQETALVPGLDSEAVYLPVAKSETDGLSEKVYWLDTTGKNASRQPPLRLAPLEAAAEIAADDSASSASFSLVHRELVDYNPKLRAGAAFDRWVWTDLQPDIPGVVQINMPDFFKPSPGTDVRVTLKYGFTNFPPVQPALHFIVGGHEAAVTTLTVQQGTAILDIPAELFIPGENDVALRLDYPFGTHALRSATLQTIQTDWSQELVPPTVDAYLQTNVSGTTSGKQLAFTHALAEDAVVLGYQQDLPFLLSHTGRHATWKDQSFSSFYVGNRSEAEEIPLMDRVLDPPLLSNFVSNQSIIIAAPELTSAALSLLPMHEARGLSAQVYSARTIYDAFSYGKKDPRAIRNFLRYLFNKAPGDSPEYVTLVGEASDFKGDPSLVPASTQMDMLPASTAATPDAVQGDQLYAAAIGSDLMADFIVGRIPAASARQVSDYVEKIRTFEQASHGDWSRVTEFVMDDNDEFPDVVSRIVSGGLAPPADTRLFRQWNYDYVPNLRVPGKKRSWSATETLIDKFNDGIGVLNFFGHGGPNLWSHERLLHLSDLPELTNQLRLPLITCASCDNAWITYPTPPVKASMGEQMVLKKDGGALGLFGPVAGASPYEHSTLVQSLMEGVTRQQLRRIGDLVTYAENQYYAITRSASIPDQYLLLGDPTVSLPMPRVQSNLNAELTGTNGEGKQLSFTLANGSSLNTTGVLQLSSPGEGNTLSTQVVTAASLPWHATLPQKFAGGVVYALLEWQDAAGETKLSGTLIEVPPLLSPAVRQPELVGREGEMLYEISAISLTDDAPAASQFKFQIRSLSDTTGSVRLEAFTEDNNRIAEIPHVEITTGSQWSHFDLNVSGQVEAPETTVSLQVSPLDEQMQAGTAVTTYTFVLPVQGFAELEFVPGSTRVYSGDNLLLANKTVYLEARLRNTGAVAARNVTVQVLRDNPTTGSELETINDSTSFRLDEIKPDETETVVFRWENASRGMFSDLFLTVNRNKVVQEDNYENNAIRLPEIEVQDMGNYTIKSLAVSPVVAAPGTTVSLSTVLYNNAPHNLRPVTLEIGWGRTLDGETTSTRIPVSLEDGYATVTKELIVPEGYTFAFAKANADFEIEESNSGDNIKKTENMIAALLSRPESGFISLDKSLVSGLAYNLDMPIEGQLNVSPQFTSVTGHLLVDHQNITTGSASATDVPDDNAWWVTPWRVAASEGEQAGEIGFRLPLDTVRPDVPGLLRGYFMRGSGGAAPAIQIAKGNKDWTAVKMTAAGERFEGELGIFETRDGALEWNFRQVNTTGVTMESMMFYPWAVQWDSQPYLLPKALRSQLLQFEVDTDDLAAWSSFNIEWRSGTVLENGEIDWTLWQTVPGFKAPLSSEEYLQLRIIGVPVRDQKPLLRNFRLSQL